MLGFWEKDVPNEKRRSCSDSTCPGTNPTQSKVYLAWQFRLKIVQQVYPSGCPRHYRLCEYDTPGSRFAQVCFWTLSICYHVVCESVAISESLTGHIFMHDNPADIWTKIGGMKWDHLVGLILSNLNDSCSWYSPTMVYERFRVPLSMFD
jgi:hypothetical protein